MNILEFVIDYDSMPLFITTGSNDCYSRDILCVVYSKTVEKASE